MLNYYWEKFGFVAKIVFVVLLAFSITSQAVEKKSERAKHSNRIAIISFQAITPEAGTGNAVRCPICGIVSSSGKILEGSEKIVEEVFVNKLNELEGLELIPSKKVQSIYKKISSEKPKRVYQETLRKVGNELGADYLAIGFVYRYAERVGYKYSSEHPASVVFEIHLIRTNDGSIIWRGFFDKTQKSLTENVLDISSFFRGGAKWVTARQLTEQGMDDVFETFPDFQD